MLIPDAKREVYQKLMKYAFQKCDVIKVTKPCDTDEDLHKQVIQYILSDSGYSVEQLVTKYTSSSTFLRKMYERYKNDPNLFDEEYQKWEEHSCMNKACKNGYRESRIGSSIDWLVYHINTTKWLEKYKNNIIYKKHVEQASLKEETFASDCIDIYYLKLTEELKQDILARNSLHDGWHWPDSVENPCFFKGNICWLDCIAGGFFDIYCDNEEEFEYLKSMGVWFFSDEFMPEDSVVYADYHNHQE